VRGLECWTRELTNKGHRVWLIAPHDVKSLLKGQKDGAAEAEAASRQTLRLVEPKTNEQQAHTVGLRTREHLVKQRTEASNPLRG
jgi:transposase